MKPWIKWTALILAVVMLFGGCGYLFWYDRYQRGSPSGYVTGSYEPEVDDREMVHQLQNLNIPVTHTDTTQMTDRDGVEAFIKYHATVMQSSEAASDEWQGVMDERTQYAYPCMLTWSVTDSPQQMALIDCQYMPLVDAMGHGWLHYNGNLYASVYGREKAKEFPNFRNRFCFMVQKENVLYHFEVFCNTHNVDEAFTVAVNIFNENVK